MQTKNFEFSVWMPKLAELDDSELEAFFRYRDGPWSTTTKNALALFKTSKLDLNQHWASVPPHWLCPSCNRSKSQVFRLTGKGVLMAHLHLHHDHMEDALKDRIKERLGPKWLSEVDGIYGQIVGMASRTVRRFGASLVCSDCNSADATAKKNLSELPKEFSFSPVEITKFIKPRPNQDHIVSLEKALDLFREIESDLPYRFDLIQTYADLICDGRLKQIRSNLHGFESFNQLDPGRHIAQAMVRWSPSAYQEVSADLVNFQARSLARDGVGNKPLDGKRSIKVTPTEEEFLNYDGGSMPELWRTTKSSWQCPICERAKIEILRRGNNTKRKWAGNLARHIEYKIIEVLNVEEGTYEDVVDHQVTFIVCMDCANVVPQLKQRVPQLSTEELRFWIEDLKAICNPSANQRHEVDWDLAGIRGAENLDWAYQIRKFQDRYRDAVSCYGLYNQFLKEEKTPALAWDHLRWFYLERLHWDAENIDNNLQFLLQEAPRLKSLDNQVISSLAVSEPDLP